MTNPDLEYLQSMPEYLHVQEKGEAGIVGIYPLMFTYGIIAEMDRYSCGNRWCYKSYDEAKAALDAWDGTGEPTGWHRHVQSGRRIDENGNLTINF